MHYNHQQSVRVLQVVYKLQTPFPLVSSRCIFPVFLSASLKMAWGPLLFIYPEQSPKFHFPSSRVPNWTISLVSTLLSLETDSLNSRQKQLSKMQMPWGPSSFYIILGKVRTSTWFWGFTEPYPYLPPQAHFSHLCPHFPHSNNGELSILWSYCFQVFTVASDGTTLYPSSSG